MDGAAATIGHTCTRWAPERAQFQVQNVAERLDGEVHGLAVAHVHRQRMDAGVPRDARVCSRLVP
jgi:hypothetical protein